MDLKRDKFARSGEISMKVRTDLKAGNIVSDASYQADSLVQGAQNTVGGAINSVTGFTNAAVNKAQRLWNCIARQL